MKSRKKLSIELLWEVALALLSFILFKTLRLFIRTLIKFEGFFNQKTVFQWQVLSNEMLEKNLGMLHMMTTGPRWNTHAICATVGPFYVRESLAIEVETCVSSAQSWSIGIYNFPNFRLITCLTSYNLSFQEKWHLLELNKGRYVLGLRYYNWFDKVDLPAIKIHDNQIVNTQRVDGKVNDFFIGLIERDNIFYLALHYYVFTILVLQKQLPQSWITKEYLPVGDPNNKFVYGAIYKNYSLTLKLNPSLLNNHDIYLTIYNRSSLPVIWYQLKEEKHITPVIEKDGFYLVRLRPKSSLASSHFQSDWIEVVLSCGCANLSSES
ncbi:MAG: hypothetical protein KME55_26590 [Nostoc indistinguendum CM1-VF10]|jgi:hypothetical protein|nr:hypothetical protein [Nostoc indistinguendum CM1-VF10]